MLGQLGTPNGHLIGNGLQGRIQGKEMMIKEKEEDPAYCIEEVLGSSFALYPFPKIPHSHSMHAMQ